MSTIKNKIEKSINAKVTKQSQFGSTINFYCKTLSIYIQYKPYSDGDYNLRVTDNPYGVWTSGVEFSSLKGVINHINK